jgi:ATP-dependent DNA helicase RecQ
MNDFTLLCNILKQTDNIPNVEFESRAYRRLYRTLMDPYRSPLDVAILMRGILRTEAERQNGVSPILSVPNGTGWPSPEQWEQVGVLIVEMTSKRIIVQAQPWKPKWIAEADTIEKPLFALEPRTVLEAEPGDPFLSIAGRQEYRCRGQKDAIRSIVTAPSDATLVIALPTGTGKSLCALLPALLDARDGGVTVVVVPTVALALDQERAAAPFVSHKTAYYAGANRDAENKAIQERIKNGTQKIVFTSPEGLLQSLSFALQMAAQRGYLRGIVIDEAHMIDVWGDDFRPAFQELAGWRKQALRISPRPFKTLLLSATITESCLDTLETLFSSPGPFEVFSAMHLRPEPSFWVQKCSTEQVKRERLIEAIHHLPRPLILYTSKVEDAKTWARYLQEVGYKRLDVMTGETSSDRREKIILQWEHGELDIVVATSAFGLGVDQTEVRAVLHACVPESIDRFYQEVGRGGRDGNASLSLLLYTQDDIEIAKSMNEKMLISIERGQQRWTAMFYNKKEVQGQPGVFRVPINVAPSNSPEDIDMSSKANMAWNVRTLTLMSRAGLLELEWEEWKPDQYEGQAYRSVRILEEAHLTDMVWQKKVSPYRMQGYLDTRRNFERMEALLRGETCNAELFGEVYTVPRRESRAGITVRLACGGCEWCRRHGEHPYAHSSATLPIDWSSYFKTPISDALRQELDVRSQLVVWVPSMPRGIFSEFSYRERKPWFALIHWLISQGINHIVAPASFLSSIRDEPIMFGEYDVLLSEVERYPLVKQWPKTATLYIHPQDIPVKSSLISMIKNGTEHGQPMVYFLPEQAEDPVQPNRRLCDTLFCRSYSLTEWKKEVGI